MESAKKRLMTYLDIKENEPTLFPEMEANIAIKTFIRFLYENGVYSKFKNNFAHVPDYWAKADHDHACCSDDFIRCAFRWCNTPEEHLFWEDIHCKWVEHYRNEILKK